MIKQTTDNSAIKKLESIAKEAESLDTRVSIIDGDGKERVLALHCCFRTYACTYELMEKEKDNSGHHFHPCGAKRTTLFGDTFTVGTTIELERIMKGLIQACDGSRLQAHKTVVRGKKLPINTAELKEICIQSWSEAFGARAPSAEELKMQHKMEAKSRKSEKQDLVRKLTRGVTEISSWNSQSNEDRQRADLKRINLSSSNLQGINFTGLSMAGANLVDCDLTEAQMCGANLSNAILDRSKLKAVNLRHADLEKASFIEANFIDSHMTKTKSKGADFSGSTMEHVDLSLSSLGKAVFDKTNLSNVEFCEASLDECSFKSAVIENVTFKGASLKSVDFSDAKLVKVSLQQARLSGAKLAGATFVDVSLDFAKYDEDTTFPPGLHLSEKLIWDGKGPEPRRVKEILMEAKKEPRDFNAFMEKLQKDVDSSRLKKALAMLKNESFQLFSEVSSNSITGVVKSQTNPELVYSCRLMSGGSFSCCTQNLNQCGGLSGALCKHLLVLLIGLSRAGELNSTDAEVWMNLSKLQKPTLDKDIMSETLLKYQSAVRGEIDWRPTETIPEDYYAF
ncbi:MAG: pentapeptide repeat-containing protein [Cyanobacteria bacterium]|nr:pentapeptide repeat-containing protein [Cyanobacteriota bacterium]